MADIVMAAKNSLQIKHIGNNIDTRYCDWHSSKYRFMWELLSAKAVQSDNFLDRLRLTGQAPLFHTVEDDFWGSGLSGVGPNLFGKLLEQIRSRWCW